MTSLTAFTLTIAGRAVGSSATLGVINTATEQVIAHSPDASHADVDHAVAAARAACPGWRDTPYADRQAALGRIAGVLMDHAEELKALLTAEQGKPLAEALGEIHAAAWWIGETARYELPITVTDAMPGQRSVTRHVPLGVVGAIVPWNFPILLAVWKIGPALLAGNTMVLKPSPMTPLTTLRLGELLRGVLPDGVLNVISGGDAVGPWLTEHTGIDKISFTGSTATGRRVMASAAANLKRLTLELGGNDAAIVLDDADVEAIAEPLFWAAFKNSGQVCVAAKRIYADAQIYDALAQALKRVAQGVVVGDGTQQGTMLGPVQNRQQFARVSALIEDSRDAGHTFLTGGDIPGGPGFFVPVTIIDNPPEQSRVVQEEAFGPVLPLIRFDTVEDAIARANASEYGLGGSVWSSNPERAADVARRLDTGTVWINSAQNLTPYAAFAGAKQSGMGTENSLDGLLEFTTPQTIHMARAD